MTGLLGIVVNVAVEVAVDCAPCPGGIDSAGNAREQNILTLNTDIKKQLPAGGIYPVQELLLFFIMTFFIMTCPV